VRLTSTFGWCFPGKNFPFTPAKIKEVFFLRFSISKDLFSDSLITANKEQKTEHFLNLYVGYMLKID